MNSAFNTNPEIQEEILEDISLKDLLENTLVVHNDDVNTFDWVIKSLIDICGHSQYQAEQLTVLVHYKGKAKVKNGPYSKLRALCNKFIERGINATVD
ncbi:MAG: ATP-dependent Clp protease adaptor ClpS [Bacteroidetes bacterium]|nr:ATP-dependent Clp protease adaptor ClpS [Bacteroidota bacterium]